MTKHQHFRNWWPLLWMIIDASIANALCIYRLRGFKEADISQSLLQERLGLQLLRNPASVNRVKDPLFSARTNQPSLLKHPQTEHGWTSVILRECVVCKPLAQFGRGLS
jgi:hypothetical protein